MTRINIKDGLTPRQIERQKIRHGGKYSKYPRCELCGKMIISGKHSSDSRCNIGGVGLVLDKKCCIKSGEMNNKTFLETFGKGFTLNEKKEYIKRLNEEFPDYK